MIRLLIFPLVWCLAAMPVQASNYDLTPLQEMALGLQELGPLISEAKRNTDRAERFKFEYANLISDLAIIHNGLVAAATGKEDQSHEVRTLFGQYGFVGRTAESKYLTMLKRELQMHRNTALSLVPTEENPTQTRTVNYAFIAADFSAVIDAITVSLAGAGDRPRRFPALGGGNL